MEGFLKVFVVNSMPLRDYEATTLINDFINTNRNKSEYSHLFENESKMKEKVIDFLKDDGKIVRPCSMYFLEKLITMQLFLFLIYTVIVFSLAV